MAGSMTCDFMSFATVFQSYQDDGRLVMICRLCAMELHLQVRRFRLEQGSNLVARSVGQRLTH